MIRLHSIVLIICSCIGFAGHYVQYGVARLTPWIPATIGIFIFLFSYRVRKENGIMKYLPIVPVFIFGIVTTIMCARFLPQEIQPVRKKIIFCLMTISAWATVGYGLKEILKLNRKKANN